MGKLAKISDSEYEVMEVIWAENNWIDISGVHQILSKAKKWAYNTVGTFMLRLTDKGYLKTEKRGKSNFYFPLITEEQYVRAQTEEFLNLVHKGSKKSLLAALYDDSTSQEELDDLMRWLEKK